MLFDRIAQRIQRAHVALQPDPHNTRALGVREAPTRGSYECECLLIVDHTGKVLLESVDVVDGHVPEEFERQVDAIRAHPFHRVGWRVLPEPFLPVMEKRDDRLRELKRNEQSPHIRHFFARFRYRRESLPVV